MCTNLILLALPVCIQLLGPGSQGSEAGSVRVKLLMECAKVGRIIGPAGATVKVG